jgi:NTP pyrophosphatase (non-canonical NTP hydrolase)
MALTLGELQKRIVHFRDARDWAQFHTAKDLAMSLSIEAGELLELFLWKDPSKANPEHIADEIADVIHTALLVAEHYNIDVEQACTAKLKKNEAKYPVETSKGRNLKYTELTAKDA